MMGIEFVTDKQSKQPDTVLVRKLVDYCIHHGLIVESAGAYSNVIRFLCPLVVTDAQLESGLAILESAIESCR